MKSCFRIQIGNTYAILKTLRFFLWESKFLLKFNCNWQFSAHSAFPRVANLLLLHIPACSAVMHRSLCVHRELTKCIFTRLIGIDHYNVFLHLNTFWSGEPGRLQPNRKQGSVVVMSGWPGQRQQEGSFKPIFIPCLCRAVGWYRHWGHFLYSF